MIAKIVYTDRRLAHNARGYLRLKRNMGQSCYLEPHEFEARLESMRRPSRDYVEFALGLLDEPEARALLNRVCTLAETPERCRETLIELALIESKWGHQTQEKRAEHAGVSDRAWRKNWRQHWADLVGCINCIVEVNAVIFGNGELAETPLDVGEILGNNGFGFEPTAGQKTHERYAARVPVFGDCLNR